MLVSGLRGSSLGYLPHHHFSPVTVAGAAAVSSGERMEWKYVGLSPHHHPPPVTAADAGEWKGWVVSPTTTHTTIPAAVAVERNEKKQVGGCFRIDDSDVRAVRLVG